MIFSSRDRRVFAIGDIHGCARELGALLKKIDPGADDTVVFLGDYIDRGPDSRGVVDLILELKKKTKVVALKGNHESMFLDFIDYPEAPGAGMFILNGGSSTLASYANVEGDYELPEAHIQFFRNLKICFETKTHFFVHAGVPIGPLSDLDPEMPEVQAQLMWMRQPFLTSTYQWEKIVVHGHTPIAKVEDLPNRINLDTGCVYGNSLTALELPAHVFHSVERGVRHDVGLLPSEPARLSRRFSGNLPLRAGRPGEPSYEYETLNYNQFGLLMRDTAEVSYGGLKAGDPVVGEIGQVGDGNASEIVKFVGGVVRTDSRGEYVLYAIRIDKISGGVWGVDWVERPAG
jgi:serine/threonine protein phosphatase 1